MVQELEELQRLQQSNSRLQLKLEHYKQKVNAQEDQIADLRVEVTELAGRVQHYEQTGQEFVPQEAPVDAELVD